MTNIVVLTGAGVSAESGIRTFRASDGLWEDHRIEDVASPEGFARNPALVYDFYNQRRRQLLSAEVAPNAAHEALAQLQAELGVGAVTLVTQNVDDLHERVGAKVWHMHGELLKVRCEGCGAVHEWRDDCDADSLCLHCEQAGQLRPHIVWFGEMPFFMSRIEATLYTADYFVSIGTSGGVYPAAGFVALARSFGAKTIEINLEASANASLFDQGYYGKATIEVPRWVQAVLA